MGRGEGMANDGGSLLLAFLHLFFIPPPYSPSLGKVYRITDSSPKPYLKDRWSCEGQAKVVTNLVAKGFAYLIKSCKL